MKGQTKTWLLFLFLQPFLYTNAQLGVESLIGVGHTVGKGLIDKIQNKKKAKNIEAALTQVDINGTKIPVLRISEDKIISDAKVLILKIQQQLDYYSGQYHNGAHIDFSNYDDNIYTLKVVDKDWPVVYYETELAEYKKYGQVLVQKERRINDSIRSAQRLAEQRLYDSLRIARKRTEDSLSYAIRTKDYHFVNREYVLLKEKPTEKSKTKGRVYLGSYVRVLGYSDTSRFVKIAIENETGFVSQNDIVPSLDQVNQVGADVETYKSRVYYRYEPNFDYVAGEEKPQAPAFTGNSVYSGGTTKKQSSSSRSSTSQVTYYTGPRGGCYYLTSSGTKVYVDRSFCR